MRPTKDTPPDSIRPYTTFDHISIKSPLSVSNFQGDAVFSFAASDHIIQSQTLVETIESMYIAFTNQRETMRQNTTCECTACKNMTTLDLKICIHHGTFAVDDMGGGRQELSGQDVILIHRIMKNSVRETTGVHAYAAFTDAALDAIDLPEWRATLKPHQEEVEHIGTVSMGIDNLKVVWEERRQASTFRVAHHKAQIHHTADAPISPATAWDYLTEPEHKRRWMEMKSVARENTVEGRYGVRTQYHCAHEMGDFFEKVVSWHPFEYFSFDSIAPGGVTYLETFEIEQTDDGVRMHVLVNVPAPKNPIKRWMTAKSRTMIQGGMDQTLGHCMAHLADLIREDIASGALKPLEASASDAAG
ncbi:MAG: DUF2652 domain-containing protein [Candidatus Poribacteria bacterium]|nr:DUF2652 domain-containing protein [Candidatus Poribacteria bacterium]